MAYRQQVKFNSGTFAHFLQFAFLLEKVGPAFEGVVHAALNSIGAKLLTSNRLLLKGQHNQRATRPKIKEEK